MAGNKCLKVIFLTNFIHGCTINLAILSGILAPTFPSLKPKIKMPFAVHLLRVSIDLIDFHFFPPEYTINFVTFAILVICTTLYFWKLNGIYISSSLSHSLCGSLNWLPTFYPLVLSCPWIYIFNNNVWYCWTTMWTMNSSISEC